MERDTFAFQVYDCIRRRTSEIRECVDEICARDFKLKYCLEVYKHLTALRSGLDFTTQCRNIESELESVICAALEGIGVPYEAYANGRQSAVAALEEKASTRHGREALFHTMNDMMDFFDERHAALHRIVHLQSRVARTAFQIERLRLGAGDVCVEEFIRRRETELFDEQELLNLSDVSAGIA